MIIRQAIIPSVISDKLWRKHRVTDDEVDQVFKSGPNYRRIENGDVLGEDLYAAFGKTEAGRWLSVFFIYKRNHDALVISARNMTKSERRQYAKT